MCFWWNCQAGFCFVYGSCFAYLLLVTLVSHVSFKILQKLISCTGCVYNRARIEKEWMLQLGEGGGGGVWLKWRSFPLSVLSYFCKYSVDSKYFLKHQALKIKYPNIQLSHLLSLSFVLFGCVVFWLFAILFFSIVSEAGASIYSVSPEASKEMPDLDPNLRSAGMKCISSPFQHGAQISVHRLYCL